MFKIETEKGKYIFINDNGVTSVIMNDQLWEDGDAALLSLLKKVEKYENVLKEIAKETGTPYAKIAIKVLNEN